MNKQILSNQKQMRNIWLLGVLPFMCFIFLNCQKNQEEQVVSIASLLKEMTSRDVLTRYPNPSYITKHASSYDRRSVSNEDKLWFANDDNNSWIREEENNGRKEYVLLESNDPGAITHFWMTGLGGAGKGTLRIYIDDFKEPVINEPLRNFISQNTGVGYPLSCSVSPISPVRQRGHNLYLPIPYAKSCKITYQTDKINTENRWKGEVFYYNIDYRKYGSDVKIKSFTKNAIADNKDLILKTNQMLLDGRFTESAKSDGESFQVKLNPGEEQVVFEKKAGAAIDELNMRIHEDMPTQSLRSLIVKCTFDNQQTVWAPIGDFFGAGYRIDAYETRFNKVSVDGNLKSRWVMPFKESCKITIENIGQTSVGLNGSVQFKSYQWTDESMYFYASWHQYTKVKTADAHRSMLSEAGENYFKGINDMNYVTLEGKGVFVGDVLTLFNDNTPLDKDTWTKADGSFRHCWWGEGDEKIYIDGETFPSHFGTGTEDYYCYAWCMPDKFTHPFIAQPSGEGNITPGYTVNARVRTLDALPFTKSFHFDMELWHWNVASVNYAPTTFYYMKPGGKTNRKPDYEGAKEQVLLDYEKLHTSKED